MGPLPPAPLGLFRRAPILVWLVLLWVGVELGAAFVLPRLVSGERYLDWFQPPRADSSVALFLGGGHILTPDSIVGWRSTPLAREGSWRTDARGARSTGRWEWGDPGALNVVLSGSSLINGGTTLSNDETVSAVLEGPWLRTLDYATMLYGLDQTLLDYRTRLRALRPDVLVVGVDPDALRPIQNLWVPLRRPGEVLMPFVKPRFRLAGDSLVLVRANPWDLLSPEDRGRLLRTIREEDGLVHEFHTFVRFGQTPLASLVARGWEGIRGRRAPGAEDPEELLLDRILEELRRAVQDDGVRLVVLSTPPGRSATATERERVRARVARWRSAGLEVVDGERAFVDHRVPGVDLFLPDGEHYSPAGHRVLAGAVAEVLAR